MFFFSPRRTLLPIGLSVLGLGPERDLTSWIPPRKTVERVVGITRHGDQTRIDLEDIVEQIFIVLPYICDRLSGNQVSDLVPSIRQVVGEPDKSLLEELVFYASPPSGRRVSRGSGPTGGVLVHSFREAKGWWSLFGFCDWDSLSWRFRIQGGLLFGGRFGKLCFYIYTYRERK